MCTVVVGFDPQAEWPVVLLGLRDEMVDRPWDPPGAWWPDLGPGVVGVHDRAAGGAWLATNASRSKAAVVLNRHEEVAEPEGGYVSRGVLPLEAVTGDASPGGVPGHPPLLPSTRSFNLVVLSPDEVSFTRWDGSSVRRIALEPGVHLITHEGPDVHSVPRERRWLPEFQAARRPSGPREDGSWDEWLGVLASSAGLPTDDDEALFRSDVLDGVHYASLSVSALALRSGEAALELARLPEPGHLTAPLAWV
ncbi:NRDE family protein [Frondihabitans cladoniiphilus]|uniref:NRDE family protein n=1 Tax=Frondihabitans cladoniiphilus TaxID=715785 RepID=UPI0031E8596C